MTVNELNRDQLDELKESLYYQIYYMDSEEVAFAVIDSTLPYTQETLPDYPHEIPDSIIFAVYAGISFVNDDFFCTMGE